MELQAHVQGRFPFAGKERVPGDILTAEELALTTPQVIKALIDQRLIVLDGDDAGRGSAEDFAELKQLVVAQGEVIASLRAAFEKGGEQLQEQIEGLRTALATLARQRAPAPAVKAKE